VNRKVPTPTQMAIPLLMDTNPNNSWSLHKGVLEG